MYRPGKHLSLSEVQRVLQLLLTEQVPVRPLGPILEALGDYASHTKDLELLAEHVRVRLARSICAQYRDNQHVLRVITLGPDVEQRVVAVASTNRFSVDPGSTHELVNEIKQLYQRFGTNVDRPVLLVDGKPRTGACRVKFQRNNT